jgi:hypothetical protein
MKSKLNINLSDRLKEARNEGLKNMKETPLRPHGKLWGMDTFSWYQPNFNLVANTLHAFPFPIVWIGNSKDINNTILEDSSVCLQLKTVIVYDNSKINFSIDALEKIENIVGVSSLENAFIMLKSLKIKNAVFLFSASGENWKENRESFEDFLNIHQTK